MSNAKDVLDEMLGSRGNRRRAAQTLAAAAGSMLLLKAATGQGGPLVSAQDSGDDDDSGRGRGRGGDDGQDNSGPGNADDRDDDHEEDHDEDCESVPVTGQVPEGAVEIRIVSEDAGGFVPGELTVELGQTVAFVNAHDDEHTATGSGFDTGEIDRGEVATVVLDTPGTFAYACQFHPEMTGTISVRGEDGVVPETQAAAQEIPAGATPVRIFNLAFDPAEVTVPTGTAVVWTNDDTVPHTVTSADGSFDSGIFDPGGSFTWTVDQPGSFAYLCQLHPQMQGTVIVEGEATAGASPAPSTANENDSTAPQAAASQPAASQPAAPTDLSVSIVDFAFEPAMLAAQAGSTVVWTNAGQTPHTVTGDFADSGILEPGQTFSHTFAEAGEFGYACALHPDMIGTVSVGAGAESAQTALVAAPVDGPQGVWLVSLTPDDESLLGAQRALVTFGAGGTIEADFAAAPGTDLPVTVLTSGRGEWVVQDQVCGVALVALMSDANQRFAGTVTIDAEGQLDSTGRAFDGTFNFALDSADGQTLGQGSGTIRGGLIPLDP